MAGYRRPARPRAFRVPDADFDAFVDTIASRIAQFDHDALTTAKKIVNQRTEPASGQDIAESTAEFYRLASSPTGQARLSDLLNRGMQQRGDFELNFGAELGKPGPS